MRNTFTFPLCRRSPVHRKSLGTRSDDHPDEFVSVAFGEPKGLVENLDRAIFRDPPDKPALSTAERQRVSPAEVLGQGAHTDLAQPLRALTGEPSFEVTIVRQLKRVRPLPEVPQGTEPISLPDLLLPQSVVAFDSGIGGGPPLGGKDGHHTTG